MDRRTSGWVVDLWRTLRAVSSLLRNSFPEVFDSTWLRGRFFFQGHQLVAELLRLSFEFRFEPFSPLGDLLAGLKGSSMETGQR